MGRAAVVCDQHIREVVEGEEFAEGGFSSGAEGPLGPDGRDDLPGSRGFGGPSGEGDENVRRQREDPLRELDIVRVRPAPQREQVAGVGIQKNKRARPSPAAGGDQVGHGLDLCG